MSSDDPLPMETPAMTDADLVEYVNQELSADAERQAKLQAAAIGELPTESPAGATLNLSKRGIRVLPVEVIALIKEKVERLALSRNAEIILPPEIVQCHRLRYLNLRWNQLQEFPKEVLGLKNLEILDLSKNRIVEIPESLKLLTSLKFFAISSNQVTRLPLALGEMPTLQKIIFDNNPIQFPPPEALKIDNASLTGEDKRDACQVVKRFMRERMQETPRPVPRSKGGRFPIRPSESNIETLMAMTNDERGLGSISQRVHNRKISTASFVSDAAGSTAPTSLNNSVGSSRSRSETASSAASMRARRQGMIRTQKSVMEEVETSDSNVDKNEGYTLTAKKILPTETPALTRPLNGSVASFDAFGESPKPPPTAIHDKAMPQQRPIVRNVQISSEKDQQIVTVINRLHAILGGLQYPLQNILPPLPSDIGPGLQISPFTKTEFSLRALEMHLQRAQELNSGQVTGSTMSSKLGTTIAVLIMRQYANFARTLRAVVTKTVSASDAFHVRGLMFQLHIACTELQNICSSFGFRIKQQQPPRTPLAWSSKSVTPTQQSRVANRRLRGATILQSMGGEATFRAMPPPALPISAHTSRSNTMSTTAPLTARSGESFGTFPLQPPSLSRSSTLHSVTDESDNEQQFNQIYKALKNACEMTMANTAALRAEIIARKDKAQSDGQSVAARDWDRALALYEIVMANDNALLKRLRSLRLNDPAVRYQSDFWQLCDKLVQSWADLASHIKNLSSRNMDISNVKALMRDAQKAMKTMSKTISNSPLYNSSPSAASRYGPDTSNSTASLSQYSTQSALYPVGPVSSRPQTANGYASPATATPLSAALGPAAQAISTHGSFSSTAPPSRDYFPPPMPLPPPPTTARLAHERIDTVMQNVGNTQRRVVEGS